MSVIGWVHFIFCLVAILAGAVVVLLPKGTRWHRTWGHLYATTMAGVVVSALSLYEMTGRFGPFHIAAVVAAVTIVAGLYAVLGRRPRRSWLEAHAYWMAWSYIGLMAAAAAETLTRFVMPLAAPYFERHELWGVFWGSVGVATFNVVGIGWWLVKTRMPGALAGTPHAVRRERQELRAMETGVEGSERTTPT